MKEFHLPVLKKKSHMNRVTPLPCPRTIFYMSIDGFNCIFWPGGICYDLIDLIWLNTKSRWNRVEKKRKFSVLGHKNIISPQPLRSGVGGVGGWGGGAPGPHFRTTLYQQLGWVFRCCSSLGLNSTCNFTPPVICKKIFIIWNG